MGAMNELLIDVFKWLKRSLQFSLTNQCICHDTLKCGITISCLYYH